MRSLENQPTASTVGAAMGVEIRTEADLVFFRLFGAYLPRPHDLPWTEHVRAAAERSGGPVPLLCIFEAGVELPATMLGAGARQTLAIVPLIRASAMVAEGAREKAMLRVSVLAVKPSFPAEIFEDEASARAWLAGLGRAATARISA